MVRTYRLGVMFIFRLIKSPWGKFQRKYGSMRTINIKKENEEQDITKIRNIGILAHIDAGKTTTTERMLFYSGFIKHMGEVHHGNTVTDYMDQERQRGITITSAAVTFKWKNYHINLIDTPGHIDFTMEVEQTLRVLDGAVVILDGSAGVEAQTLTVCRQADKYDIPRIIYVNKMDRPDANFDTSLKSIESKLNIEVLPIQFPIKEEGILKGIVDVISLEKLIFGKGDKNMIFSRLKLSETEDKGLWEQANEKRRILIDKLSSMDDKLADIIIEQESFDAITPQMLANSLQKSTISRKGVPVLLGSSYKNIGVQPLIDSVILYLPSPIENKFSRFYGCFNENVCARVFKIVHDKRKGPITFFRIYNGYIEKGKKIYNVRNDEKEVIGRSYIAFADDYQEVSKITNGNIAAVTGLKSTMSGDLITSSLTTLEKAKKNLKAQEDINSEDMKEIFSCNLKTLEPVFFCSIEAPSLSMQSALDKALEQLVREDPSLRIIQNEETGQTELGGMGELHLEIIKERIRNEYKIDAHLGPLQISYRETIKEPIQNTYSYEYKIGNNVSKVSITMSLIPDYQEKNILLLDKSTKHRESINLISENTLRIVQNAIKAVFSHGPKLGYPVTKVGILLHSMQLESSTTISITAAVSQCVRQLMKDAGITLLEPIMNMEVMVPDEYLSSVLKDLQRRRAEIKFIDVIRQNKVVHCLIPLVELLGYSKAVRIISSGHATFSSEFDHYEPLDSVNEAIAIKNLTGLG